MSNQPKRGNTSKYKGGKSDNYSDYQELCKQAKLASEAHSAWASAAPLSQERKHLWEAYTFLRDKHDELKCTIEARYFH